MFRTRFAVATLLCVAFVSVARSQDARPFPFKLKDSRGQFAPFYEEQTTEVDQQIKVQGQNLTQRQSTTYWSAWTPIKEEQVTEGADTFTRWTVKQKIEGLRMEIDVSGNAIKYDSRKPDEVSENPGLIEFFKGLKGAEFTTTLGKGYKVEKVDGKDDFIKRLGSGTLTESLLKKLMTDDAIKEMADPTRKLLPEGPKKKGDKWEKKTSLNLGPIGSYDIINKFTYAEPEKDGAKKGLEKFELETVLMYAPPKNKDDSLLFQIKEGKIVSDPVGSKGFVYYDPAAGRVVEATINIKLKGDLVVEVGGTETKVQLIQDQKTTIKTSDYSFVDPRIAKKADPPTTPPAIPVVLPAMPQVIVVCCPQQRIGLCGRFSARPCFPLRCR